jgi:hypothetical protein
VKAPTSLVINGNRFTLGTLKQPKAGAIGNVTTGMFATLTTNGQPLVQKSVLFTVTNYVTRKVVLTTTRITDLNGNAALGVIRLAPGIYVVNASFGTAVAGSTPDPFYVASTATPWTVIFVPNAVTIRVK